MTQLRSVTCHMGSHSVTCYPTQMNTPRLKPSHAGRYSIYLPRRDGRLSSPSWLDSAPAGSWTWDLSITSPTLNQCNHQDNLYPPDSPEEYLDYLSDFVHTFKKIISLVPTTFLNFYGFLIFRQPCHDRSLDYFWCPSVLIFVLYSNFSSCVFD